MTWIKAWYVIFMVTWFAGLFYLPRLFVYHASATDADGIGRFCVMESRLFVIMTIGAVLTAAFGAWLLALNPGLLGTGWMRAKLALVALLIVLAAVHDFVLGPRAERDGSSRGLLLTLARINGVLTLVIPIIGVLLAH